MTDHGPKTTDETRELMANLVFGPPPTDEEAELIMATLPEPESEVMVVRSLRLPIDLDAAVAAAAKVDGIGKSTWIRLAIETALALQGEDQPISRADALRALTLLRSVRTA